MIIYSFERASCIAFAGNSAVCMVEDARNSTSYYEALHRHDYYELVYIYKGEGVQIINGISYSVSAGNIILLHPSDIHSFYSVSQMQMTNLCFTQTENLTNFPAHRSESPVVVLSDWANKDIKMLFALLESELKRQENSAEITINHCLDWILLILKRHTANHLSSDPLWGDLLSYISENYATVTMEDATRIVGVSTSHFCRIFRRDFMMTFHAYVSNVRIQRARYMLQSTDITITKIAESLGYSNSPCRFYQNFKEIVGVTPSEYRKKWQTKVYPY